MIIISDLFLDTNEYIFIWCGGGKNRGKNAANLTFNILIWKFLL